MTTKPESAEPEHTCDACLLSESAELAPVATGTGPLTHPSCKVCGKLNPLPRWDYVRSGWFHEGCHATPAHADTQVIRCDFGNACPGHASPDGRPCGWDNTTETVAEQRARKPATPAPAGDAEVSHDQARGWLTEVAPMVPTTAAYLLAYISQQEARQQQAEQRIAEYKASEADWREKLRAAQSALQGKDEAIAELKSHLLELGPDLDEANAERAELSQKLEAAEREVAELQAGYPDACDKFQSQLRGVAAQRDELSRKLEAAERQVEQMRARALSTDRYRCKQVRVSSNAPGLPTYIRCGKHSGHDMGHDFSGAVETSNPVAPIQECAPPDRPPPAKPLTRDDGTGQVSHLVSEYLKIQLATCEAIPNEHPMKGQLKSAFAITEQLLGGIASKLEAALTPDDVRTIAREVIAEVAERAQCRLSHDEPALLELAEAAKEEP